MGLSRWVWQVFRARPGLLLGTGALVVVVYLGLVVAAFATAVIVAVRSGWFPEAYEPDTAGNPAAFFGLYAGLIALVAVVMTWPCSQAVRVALRVIDTEAVSIRTLLRPTRPLAALALGLLLGVGTLVGLVLCVLPAIAWLVLTQFSVPALVDGDGPLRALRRSIRLVRRHLLSSVIVAAMVVGITCVVSAVPIVGMVVALPLALLVNGGAYRWLSGLEEGPVAAPRG